jgi:hypothetical protein
MSTETVAENDWLLLVKSNMSIIDMSVLNVYRFEVNCYPSASAQQLFHSITQFCLMCNPSKICTIRE